MDEDKIIEQLNDVQTNIDTAIVGVEDGEYEDAISELEMARGSIDARIKELKEEQGYPVEEVGTIECKACKQTTSAKNAPYCEQCRCENPHLK